MNEFIALLPAWCLWVAPVVIIGGMFAIIFGMAAKDRDRTTMIVIACIVVGTLAGALYTIDQPHEWQPQDGPQYWPFFVGIAALCLFFCVAFRRPGPCVAGIVALIIGALLPSCSVGLMSDGTKAISIDGAQAAAFVRAITEARQKPAGKEARNVQP